MISLSARFTSKCAECGRNVNKGDQAEYDQETKQIYHPECVPDGSLPQGEGAGKTGVFSAATDGYKGAQELADKLGFEK